MLALKWLAFEHTSPYDDQRFILWTFLSSYNEMVMKVHKIKCWSSFLVECIESHNITCSCKEDRRSSLQELLTTFYAFY